MNPTDFYRNNHMCINSSKDGCTYPCSFNSDSLFGISFGVLTKSLSFEDQECYIDELNLFDYFLKPYANMFSFTIKKLKLGSEQRYSSTFEFKEKASENAVIIHPFFDEELSNEQLLAMLFDLDRILCKYNISIPLLLNLLYKKTETCNCSPERIKVGCRVAHQVLEPNLISAKVDGNDIFKNVSDEQYEEITFLKNMKDLNPVFSPNKAANVTIDYYSIINTCYAHYISENSKHPLPSLQKLFPSSDQELFNLGWYFDDRGKNLLKNEVAPKYKSVNYMDILRHHFLPVLKRYSDDVSFSMIAKSLCIASVFTLMVIHNDLSLDKKIMRSIWGDSASFSKDGNYNQHTFAFIKKAVLGLSITKAYRNKIQPSNYQVFLAVVMMLVITTIIVSLKYYNTFAAAGAKITKELDGFNKKLEEKKSIIYRLDTKRSDEKTPEDFCDDNDCEKYTYDWNLTKSGTHGRHQRGAERIFEPQMGSVDIDKLKAKGYTVTNETVNYAQTQFSQNEMELKKVRGISQTITPFLTGKEDAPEFFKTGSIWVARTHDDNPKLVVIDGHHRSAAVLYTINTTSSVDISRCVGPANIIDIPRGMSVSKLFDDIASINGTQYKDMNDHVVYTSGQELNLTSDQFGRAHDLLMGEMMMGMDPLLLNKPMSRLSGHQAGSLVSHSGVNPRAINATVPGGFLNISLQPSKSDIKANPNKSISQNFLNTIEKQISSPGLKVTIWMLKSPYVCQWISYIFSFNAVDSVLVYIDKLINMNLASQFSELRGRIGSGINYASGRVGDYLSHLEDDDDTTREAKREYDEQVARNFSFSKKRSAKRNTKKSVKRSSKRSVKRSAKRNTKKSVKRSAKRNMKKSVKRSVKRR